MKRRILWSAVCLLYSLTFLIYAYKIRPRPDLTLAAIRASGIIRIGMDASFPPFGNIVNNAPVGLDLDVANAIAQRLAVKVQLENMGFDGLYYGLESQQVDAVISALSVDPGHLGDVLYTRPYVDVGQVLVSADNAYKKMDDLEGKRLAVEYGSSGDELARLWERRLHQLNTVRYTESTDALTAVAQGQADAALVDMVTARLYLGDHPGMSINSVTHEGYVIAVRIRSVDLAKELNRILDDMDQDGTLKAIVDKWLS